MFKDSKAFSGFSTDDITIAKDFYSNTLGLDVKENDGMLLVQLATGGQVFIYPKGKDHQPATYTVLNFPVEDINMAADALIAKGVALEHYEGMDQDERGIARNMGPAIAWFKDPAGNILSIIKL